MQANAYKISAFEALPLLDEEFDVADTEPLDVDHIAPVLAHANDDLAWDDQLDNGEEMSL